jgi:hypothetical protein
MWWPPSKSLIQVKSMKICDRNCKFLEVQYQHPDPSDGEQSGLKRGRVIKEVYNLLQLHCETLLQKHQVFTDGIKGDYSASTYLKKTLQCQDQRVGTNNVLKITHSELDFQRVFVFYDERRYAFIKQNPSQPLSRTQKSKLEMSKSPFSSSPCRCAQAWNFDGHRWFEKIHGSP